MATGRVIERAETGLIRPKLVGPPLSEETNAAVHHIGGGPAYPADPKATLRGIQHAEMAGAYVDLSYSLGADNMANCYIGRGGVSDGATLGYAGRSVSILAICNAAAPGFVPSNGLLDGIELCLDVADQRGWAVPQPFIEGHRWYDAHVTDHPTQCPSELEQEIAKIRARHIGTNVPKPPAPPLHKAPPLPRTQREGIHGDDIKQTQLKLTQWANVAHNPTFNPGAVDGWFGPKTLAAVHAFQHAAHLASDGVVGPVTWAALWSI